MNLVREFRRWRRCRKAVSHLHTLTDRELADIGITRGEIRDAVRRG